MEHQNIQPFVLKAGNSANDHINDNGQNTKLKYLYNEVKSVWMLKYGTTKMLPHHMNSILVEVLHTEWRNIYILITSTQEVVNSK